MVGTSPWWLVPTLIVALFVGRFAPSGDFGVAFTVVFPTYVAVMVLFDNLVLPRMRAPNARKATVRSVVMLVVAAVLVWSLRASGRLLAVIIIAALAESWSSWAAGPRWEDSGGQAGTRSRR